MPLYMELKAYAIIKFLAMNMKPHATTTLSVSEADLVCRQCLTEGSNFFRKWKTLSEFSDLFGIAILLSVHVSYVASLCVSLYTYGLHW